MGRTVSDLLHEFEERYEQGFSENEGWNNPPSQADFESLLANDSPSEWTVKFDELGAQLAHGYHSGRYSFWFCDWIVNDAEVYVIELRTAHDAFKHPGLFQDVYQAFDDGEWNHSGKSSDPISEYTRPKIEALVRRMEVTANK